MKRLVAAVAGLVLASAPIATATAQARASAALTGNDISWPQCGRSYPTGQAFGIVGVNGGKASNVNACFGSEWAWAQTSTGGTSQPPAQLYINTGNPGDVLAQYGVTDWPS